MVQSRTFWRTFHLSLLCLFVYLLTFHAWNGQSRAAGIGLGTLASAFLTIVILLPRNRGYFINGWDRLFHLSVPLDLALEGWLVSFHDGLGFYGCALAFCVAVGGYRTLHLRRGTARCTLF